MSAHIEVARTRARRRSGRDARGAARPRPGRRGPGARRLGTTRLHWLRPCRPRAALAASVSSACVAVCRGVPPTRLRRACQALSWRSRSKAHRIGGTGHRRSSNLSRQNCARAEHVPVDLSRSSKVIAELMLALPSVNAGRKLHGDRRGATRAVLERRRHPSECLALERTGARVQSWALAPSGDASNA